MLNAWQHNGSFVIKFRENTDVDSGTFSGRIEHLGSGQSTRFDSAEQLNEFLFGVLRRVRVEFQEADTLAESIPSQNIFEGTESHNNK